MTPFINDHDLELWLGDAVEALQGLPDGYAQMCVTSPPFFGLRDYGTGTWEGGDPGCDHLMPAAGGPRTPGPLYRDTETELRDRAQYHGTCPKCGAERVDQQIGLEPTLHEWVDALVAVFREVRRVLRSDGTLWVELADSYNTHLSYGGGASSTISSPERQDRINEQVAHSYPAGRKRAGDVKPKDLFGAPFEVAFALRADGWWLRQVIIWHKRNAMPESAKDRPTTSHSYVFLLSPSARYYFDDDAIAEPAEWARWGSQDAGKYEQVGKGSLVKPLTREQIERKFAGGRQRGAGKTGGYKTTDERNARFQGSLERSPDDDSAQLFDLPAEERSPATGSWHDHSADLERGNGKQVSADGTPAGTVRSDGWREQVDAGEGLYRRSRSVWTLATEPNRLAVCSVCDAFWDGDHPDEHCGVEVVEHFAAFPKELARRAIAAGSRSGDTVIDPFGGSGTTAIAARELGRKAVLVELRREYAVMIRERTRQQSLLGLT